MEVASVNKETVYLLANKFSMKQPEDMTLFSITRAVFVNDSSTEKGIKMEITLKRKIMSEMMTTYFPTYLLMMITFATTFFKPYFFEAALSVNLTTMLVMTTIFISKMESLPPTSDIKMIDIWLILCQLAPFVQVVLLTAMEYFRGEEERSVEKQGDSEVVRGKDKTEVALKMEDDSKPAWLPFKTKPSIGTDVAQKLLVIGEQLLDIDQSKKSMIFSISEKSLIPLAVFAAFIVYSCTAIGFYFG